ncbi:hypothetical protein [Variovorax sp. UMC13]|nr:hypothetical protein [Variovorax sp. UMC13]
MKTFLLRIVMRDGSTGHHHGLYADGFAAVITALENFPEAMRISATRVMA